MAGFSFLAAALLIAHHGHRSLCSIPELRASPGYVWRVERVGAKVDSVPRIVRARAIRADSVARMIIFQPLEWVRGSSAGAEFLTLPGVAVDRDDYNRGTIPYQTVRPAGQHGSCFAEEYRLGEQYLLLLQSDSGPRAIYWWPLGPVNEQLRGAQDAWLSWVRARVARRPS